MKRFSLTDQIGGESRLFFSSKRYGFPIVVIALTVLLTVMGNQNLASATFNSKFLQLPSNQVNWSIIGFTVIFLSVFLSSFFCLERLWPLCLAIIFGSLVAVLRFGEEINFSTRWFETPFGSIQPSEISKPLMVIVLAALFEKLRPGFFFLAIPAGITLGAAFLIFLEPDFGTALIFIFLFFVLYWMNVKDRGQLLRALLASGVFGILLWFFGLRDYQKARIIAFWYPEKAPDTYYHTQQSITMVGSGGLYGKGYLQGPGNIYGYIPADHTDFVLAVFAEERGFFGLCFFIAIWVVLLLAVLREAQRKSGFAKNLLLGVFSIFFFQTFFNMAMVLGIAPVTGIPLPFFTYGGSSMLANSLLIGLALYAWNKGEIR